MGDLVYLPVVVVFFTLMAGFVGLCDRIIGPDTESDLALTGDAASDPERAEAA